MAVYFPLAPGEIAQVADQFGIGPILSATGIPQGSINTNYRVETTAARYFLRHTTVRSAADLQFEADVLDHLRDSQFPAPRLLRARDGSSFVPLHGGRVSMFGYLVGEELTRAGVQSEHCERLGAELAKMHRLLGSFSGDRGNPYSPRLVRSWLDELSANSDPELSALAEELKVDLARAESSAAALVPRGVIHADLFLDNVKWMGTRVAAFFDFEMACRDALTLDLAITLNAWCFDGAYDPSLCGALIRGYERERPLAENERADLYHQALFGAVRYTASRVRDFHLSALPPDRLFKKDFRTYRARGRALNKMGPLGFAALLGWR